MKFITVNDNQKVSIKSYDNIFLSFYINSDLGFLFMKKRDEEDTIELDMYSENTIRRFNLPEDISPAYYIKDAKTNNPIFLKIGGGDFTKATEIEIWGLEETKWN